MRLTKPLPRWRPEVEDQARQPAQRFIISSLPNSNPSSCSPSRRKASSPRLGSPKGPGANEYSTCSAHQTLALGSHAPLSRASKYDSCSILAALPRSNPCSADRATPLLPQWQTHIDLCSYPNLSVTRTPSLAAAQSGLLLRASLGYQQSS
jgi:hypothetical protein